MIEKELLLILTTAMPSCPLLTKEGLKSLYVENPKKIWLEQNRSVVADEDNVITHIEIPSSIIDKCEQRGEIVETVDFDETIAKLDAKIISGVKSHTFPFYLAEDGQYYNDNAGFDVARQEFYSYLLNIAPRGFEFVCGAIFSLLGYSDVEVTKGSGDGGIDFMATHTICVGDTCQEVIKIRFLGQAKRYKNKVGIGEIRDFLGATELLRCGAYTHAPDEIKSIFSGFEKLSPFGAHGRMMVATSGFTSQAKMLAEAFGIRCIGADELARIFHHFKVGFIRSNTQVVFSPELFEKTINQRFEQLDLKSSSDSQLSS